MPFAQWGYPHRGREKFNEQFPADFISEAIDQTRGWFYSQLAISTLLFAPIEDRRQQDCRPAAASAAASVSQLHRAGADAGRRRAEDVQEQAELPRAERDFRSLRGRRPALVFLRQPAPLDLDPLQRAGDQGQHSRVPAPAVARLQLLRDLRHDRRFRSGRRLSGEAGELGRRCFRTGKEYRPIGQAQRAGSLDSQRAEPHGGRRGHSGWTPTTITPLASRSPNSSTP